MNCRFFLFIFSLFLVHPAWSQMPQASAYDCNYPEFLSALIEYAGDIESANPEVLYHLSMNAYRADNDSLKEVYFDAILDSNFQYSIYHFLAQLDLYALEDSNPDINLLRKRIQHRFGPNHDLLYALSIVEHTLKLRSRSGDHSDSIILQRTSLLKDTLLYAGSVVFGLQNASKYMAAEGKLEEALEVSRASLRITKKFLSPCGYSMAQAHFSLGRRFIDLELLDSAELHLKQSFEIFKSTLPRSIYNVAQLSIGLSEVYRDRNDLQKSLAYLDTTEYYAQKDSATFLEMSPKIYNRKGGIFRKYGKNDKARSYYLQSIQLAEKIGKPTQVMVAYANISNQLILLDDLKTAQSYLEKALKICINSFGEEHIYTAMVLMKLADIQYYQEEYDGSADLYNQSLEIRKKIYGENHSYVANVYTNLSVLYQKKRSIDTALIFINKALSIYENIHGPKSLAVAGALNRRANLFIDKKDYNKAKSDIASAKNAMNCDAYLLSCTDAYTHLDLIEKEVRIGLAMAKSDEDLNEVLKKQAHGVEVFNYLFSVAETTEDKANLISEFSPLFDNYVHAKLALYKSTKEKMHLQDAYVNHSRKKNMGMLQALRQQNFLQSSAMPTKLRSKMLALKRDIYKHEKELYKLKRDQAHYDSLLSIMPKLYNALDSIEEYVEDKYPIDAQLNRIPDDLKMSVLFDAIPKDAGVLDFMTGDSILTVFVIAYGEIYVFQYDILEVELKETVTKLRKSLLTTDSNYNSIEMIQLLSKPFERLKDVSQLIIIPDGVLSSIPFEVISIQDTTLLGLYSISYSNSANVLIRQKNIGNKKFEKTLSIFAPTYNADNQKSGEIATRSKMAKLPYSQLEAQELASIFGKRAIVYREDIKNEFIQSIKNSQIVHLTMHGSVNNDQPLYGNLQFASEKDPDSDQLYLYELYNMEGQSELAVLSACETGLGKQHAGAGIRSLANGFQYAGIPSVVVSLWKVPDQSTSQIMRYFYTYLKMGLPKNVALQKAKMEYLDGAVSEKLRHPYYWAGFVLVGDSSAMNFNQSQVPFWLVAMGILLLGFVTLRYFRKRT